MNKLSSQNRASLIRLASSLPAGDETRKAILAGLKKAEEDVNDLHKEAFNKKAASWKVDPKPGNSYTLGSRNHTWKSTFKGWALEGGEPHMHWVDEDGTVWEAYLYNGVVSVGSSADTLKILGKAP